MGDFTVAQAKQLFIPMREGGFGLASAELQAEPAMMASWASCAARVTERIGLGGIDDLTAEIPGLRTVPADQVPPDSSNSRPPTPRSCTTLLSSMRPDCGYADPCVTTAIGAKTRSATEPSAELPSTRKANTRRYARADTPSPRDTTLCETKLRTLRDEPAFVQTSKSLWATLPSTLKTAREWTCESPTLVRRTPMSSLTFKLPPRSAWRQLVLWAKLPPSRRARIELNTDPRSSPLETHGRIGPQGVPGHDRPRGSASPGHLVTRSHEAHLMCFLDSQRAHHRQMQRHHLNLACLALRCPPHPFLARCPAPVTSRLVTLSIRSGLLAQRSWLCPGLKPVSPCDCIALYCGSPDPMCEAAAVWCAALMAVHSLTGKQPTALRSGALMRWPSLGAGAMPAHQRPGVCLAKAKATGRVDVYTRSS